MLGLAKRVGARLEAFLTTFFVFSFLPNYRFTKIYDNGQQEYFTYLDF